MLNGGNLTIPNLYIWIDSIVFPLWAFIGIAFAFHFLGNILTGRAGNRFIRWQWPKHDHLPPLAPRLAHLTHVICMFVLAITGLYIHLPFAVGLGLRTTMRWVHYVAIILVTINLIYRLWYAFFSQQRDFREFGLRWIDIKAMPATVLYYIFVANDKPHLSKYNPLQRMTYTLFPILLVFQALTGFAIAFPTPFFGWASGFFGISSAAAWARMIHYLLNWIFIVFTTIHVYLSVTEDFPAFILFFFQIPPKHDDEEGHEPVAAPPVVPMPQVAPMPMPQVAMAAPTVTYGAEPYAGPPVYQPPPANEPAPEPQSRGVDAALMRDYLSEINKRMVDMERLLTQASGKPNGLDQEPAAEPSEEEPW